MLACRLCLRLGIDDPEQWLESVPKRVLALWMAFDAIDPIGNEAVMMAKLLSMTSFLQAAKCSGDESQQVYRCELDFLPPNYVNQPDEPIEATDDIAAVERQIAARFGR